MGWCPAPLGSGGSGCGFTGWGRWRRFGQGGWLSGMVGMVSAIRGSGFGGRPANPEQQPHPTVRRWGASRGSRGLCLVESACEVRTRAVKPQNPSPRGRHTPGDQLGWGDRPVPWIGREGIKTGTVAWPKAAQPPPPRAPRCGRLANLLGLRRSAGIRSRSAGGVGSALGVAGTTGGDRGKNTSTKRGVSGIPTGEEPRNPSFHAHRTWGPANVLRPAQPRTAGAHPHRVARAGALVGTQEPTRSPPATPRAVVRGILLPAGDIPWSV